MSIAVDRDRAFLESITSIAEEVAAAYAEDVDRDARFPQQTLDALREQRALSAFVPEELGGGGVSFEALAAACFQLGRRCGAHQLSCVSARASSSAAWTRACPAKRSR